ncbi:MAG: hypothetical protein Q8R87_05540, partial [Anaerolineaceae bacterium]|nr:hypothetical protein [Anaerolineaceae bacterium]
MMNESELPQLTAPKKQGLYDPPFEHDACGTGFVVNIKGNVSHEIIGQGLTILDNLAHRGATGSETDTGDGAGILIQVPHKFFQRESARLGFSLPGERYFGVGMLYLPQDEALRHQFEGIVETICEEEGQHVLGWRTVPTDDRTLGPTARAAQPVIRQLFVERNKSIKDRMTFERKLYVIRKRAEHIIRYSEMAGGDQFYVCSMSYKTLVYKGMLTSKQVEAYFPDLSDPDI